MADILSFKINIDGADTAIQNFDQLQRGVKELKEQLLNSEFGSKQFDDLNSKLQQAQFQLREFKKDTKEMSSTAKDFGDVGESVGALDNSMSIVTKSAGLLGAGFGNMAKSAQDSIGDITDVASSLSSLPNIILDLSKGLDVLKVSLLTNPIFIIGGVIITIGAALYMLKDKVKVIGDAFDALGKVLAPIIGWFKELIGMDISEKIDSINKSLDAMNENFKTTEQNLSNNISLLKAQSASLKEVQNAENKLTDARVVNAKKEYDLAKQRLELQKSQNNGKATEEQIKAYNEITRAYNQALNDRNVSQLTHLKEQKDAAKKAHDDALAKSKDYYAKQLTLEQDFISKSNDNFNNGYLQERTKLYQDYIDGTIKSETDLNNGLNDLDEKQSQDKIKLIQTELAQLSENTKLSNTDRVKLERDLNNQLLAAQNELANKQASNKTKDDTQLKADKQLQLEKDNLNQRLALYDAYNNGIIKKTEDLDLQLKQLQLQQDIDLLSTLEVNSKEYLALEEKIVQQEIALQQEKNQRIIDANEKAKEKTINAINKIGQSLNQLAGQLSTFSPLASALSQFSANVSASFNKAFDIFTNPKSGLLDKVSATFQAIGEIANNIQGVFDTNSQQQIQNAENEKNAKLNSLQEQLNRGVITQEKYNEQVNALNQQAAKKEDDIKRKQFNVDKGLQIVQTTMAGASAAVMAFSQLGPIGGAIAAAIIGALTVAEIAVIASQKYPSSSDSSSSASSSPVSLPSASSGGNSGALTAPTYKTTTAGVGGASNIASNSGNSGSNNEPIQVYVTEHDITTTQNRVSVIQNRASFGG